MKSLKLTAILLALLSSGCGARQLPFSSAPPPAAPQKEAPSVNLAWARNDGQLISSNPALRAQAHKDISECGAAIPPARTNQGIAGEECMNERAYYVREVP